MSTKTSKRGHKKPVIPPGRSPQNFGPIDLGPLPQYLGYALRRAQIAAFNDFRRLVRRWEVTPGEFSLLIVVANNSGLSLIRLASAFGLGRSTLSPVLESLEKRGLVNRERTETDRRFYTLSLTRAGTQKLRAIVAAVERQEQHIKAALNPGEPAVLLDMLRRVATRLDETFIGSKPSSA